MLQGDDADDADGTRAARAVATTPGAAAVAPTLADMAAAAAAAAALVPGSLPMVPGSLPLVPAPGGVGVGGGPLAGAQAAAMAAAAAKGTALGGIGPQPLMMMSPNGPMVVGFHTPTATQQKSMAAAMATMAAAAAAVQGGAGNHGNGSDDEAADDADGGVGDGSTVADFYRSWGATPPALQSKKLTLEEAAQRTLEASVTVGTARQDTMEVDTARATMLGANPGSAGVYSMRWDKDRRESLKSQVAADALAQDDEFDEHIYSPTTASPGTGLEAGAGPGRTPEEGGFLPFREALVAARALGLSTSTEWKVYRKSGARPSNLPSNPDTVYRHWGWQGYAHWLGTGNTPGGRDHEPRPFDAALATVRALGLSTQQDWDEWCGNGMRPANIPQDPARAYRGSGWRGWPHWLGVATTSLESTGGGGGGGGKSARGRFLPFGAALKLARSFELGSQRGWYAWCKDGLRPANLPANPAMTYRHDGWRGWGHWVGTERGATVGGVADGAADGEEDEDAPAFIEEEYDGPVGGYEMRDEHGKWWPVTLQEHSVDGNIVLWYGDDCDVYEGIGGGYHWVDGWGSTLKDDDGQEITLRRTDDEEGNLPLPRYASPAVQFHPMGVNSISVAPLHSAPGKHPLEQCYRCVCCTSAVPVQARPA